MVFVHQESCQLFNGVFLLEDSRAAKKILIFRKERLALF
jgi:hypothetical protein